MSVLQRLLPPHLAFVTMLTVFALANGSAAQDAMRTQFPKLHGEVVAYDQDEDRLIVVGGRTMEGPLEGTWIWDRQGWRLMLDASKTPPQRAAHTMAYNPDTRQLFLFGGMTRQPTTLLCDTWIMEDDAWREMGSPVCMDGRVRHASLVYDSIQRTMLLVSGPAIADDSTPRHTEIWRWVENQWVLADRSGPRREEFGSVAFDRARSVLVVPVLYGGSDQGTWEWNGASWNRSPAPRPSLRQTYSVTFDPRQQKVVLVGGQGTSRGPYFDDVWTWDGISWQQTTAAGGFTGRAGGTLIALASGDLLYMGGYSTELLGEMWTLGARVWRQTTLSAAAAPPARYSVGAAFDESRRRFVVFGGYMSGQYSAETWEWDGLDWKLSLQPGPGGRNSPALVYDDKRRRILMFGGDARPTGALGDTWELVGDEWRQLQIPGPPARTTHVMAYDSRRDRVVLFGGAASASTLGDTWEFDGERWTRVATDGPAPRSLHAMAYDAARGKTVLFGGVTGVGPNIPALGDTWEWDGERWSQIDVVGPSARDHTQMAFDAERRVAVLHGGGLREEAGETWTYDGRRWARAPFEGPNRRYAKMAFDPVRKVVLLYGGFGTQPSNELWALDSLNWRRISP